MNLWGSVIALILFLFSYMHLKKIRQYDTSTYFDGMDGIHASITHDSGGGDVKVYNFIFLRGMMFRTSA
ncbi:hypothetical protein ACT7DF_16445 [Bacillus cereus]